MRKRNVGLLAMSAIGAMSLAACGGGDTTTAASSAASGAALPPAPLPVAAWARSA